MKKHQLILLIHLKLRRVVQILGILDLNDYRVIPPKNISIVFKKPILNFTDPEDENNKLEKSREIRKAEKD